MEISNTFEFPITWRDNKLYIFKETLISKSAEEIN